MNISLIVEGHGDCFAVPQLLRKVAHDLGYFQELNIAKPFRLSRGKIVKEDELIRAVDLMSRKAGEDGVVLIIFDADDDCPVELAAMIKGWLDKRPDLKACVVVANREFECWYIACAEALRGSRGLDGAATCPADPDLIRDGKGWLASRMPEGYSETLDQPAFAAQLNIDQAVRSRSFRKFLKEWSELLRADAADNQAAPAA